VKQGQGKLEAAQSEQCAHATNAKKSLPIGQ